MTSEPIAAYGGIAFPVEILRGLAEKLDGRPIPFHLDHDLTKPLRIRAVEVYVRDRSDGISELRFRAEVHADDTHYIHSRPGISATVMSPLARDEHSPRRVDPQLQLSADHAWFDDEALIHAETRLIELGVDAQNLSVERAYQFAAVPDPQIYVDLALTVLLSVGSSALWDGIKLLFARRRTPPGGDATTPTTVNVEIAEGSRSLRAVVKTDDAEVARHAISALEAVAAEFQQIGRRGDATSPKSEPLETTWDESNQKWTPPS